MLYKKYPLYDGEMEIMLPSDLHMITDEKKDGMYENQTIRLGDTRLSQYTWISEDRRVVVTVTKGGSDMLESELVMRMQDYYSKYKHDVPDFKCHSIVRRRINGHEYGQMRYSSEMMSYGFYNVFVLGTFHDREMIMTLQCMESERKTQEHIFSNITDSIKILSN